MRLKVHNINKVQEAEIKLEGLTVIAGANGSGKSTVGKLLFSMIKSLNYANDNQSQNKEKRLQKRVRELYNRVSGCFNRYKNEEIDRIFPLPSNIMLEQLMELEDDESIIDYLTKILRWINKQDITPRLKSLFAQDLDNIRIALGFSQAADIASEVRVFVESEFMNKICSFGTENSEATIEFDSPEEKLQLNFTKDQVNHVSITGANALSDATYVESPLYLHILDTLLYSMTYREYQKRSRITYHGMVPIHIKDLANKIYALQMSSSNQAASQEFGLEDIMGGQFMFDNDSKTLKFSHNDINLDLSPINIASGIKTFGLIQILLETQVIGSNKILIWDEPENHLHPEWQIQFAEILVKLAKKGIPVVISTHSPYFVQGIRYFAAKHTVEKYTNYYLAEEQENHLSVLKDVTDDLNQVFSKLAKPLSEIMNVDKVRRESQQQ